MSLFLLLMVVGLTGIWLGVMGYLMVRGTRWPAVLDMTAAERQARMNQALQIQEEDLVLNRQGMLSDRQKGRVKWSERGTRMLSILGCFLAGVALINGVSNAVAPSGFSIESIPVILFFFIIFTAIVYFCWFFYFRTSIQTEGQIVQAKQGKIQRSIDRLSFNTLKSVSSLSYSVSIQDVVLEVPRSLFKVLDEQKTYRVFFLASVPKRLVGIEEVG